MRSLIALIAIAAGCASPRGNRDVEAQPVDAQPVVAHPVDSRRADSRPVDSPDPSPTAVSPAEPSAAPPAAPTVVLPDVPPVFARSKLGLILAVEEALRAGSIDALAALMIDAATAERACAGAADRDEVLTRVGQRRARIATDIKDCLALVDWNKTHRLVLNYGTKVTQRRCGGRLEELEDSELFFATDVEVFKVKLFDMFRAANQVGLTRMRCSKKTHPPSSVSRLRISCPGGPWQRVTQFGAECPKP